MPVGNLPVPERFLSSITNSEFSRSTEKTRVILPIAKTLFLIIWRRCSGVISAAAAGTTTTDDPVASLSDVPKSSS